MVRAIFTAVIFLIVTVCCAKANGEIDSVKLFTADHPYIQYMGRIDFTNPLLPRFWQPGVSVTIHFTGLTCEIVLNDEELWGKNHNYMELIIDDRPMRLQTKSKTNTIKIAGDASRKIHTLNIFKNTEANIGYLELVGFRCMDLVKPSALPQRKIEFIGNSITCGAGSDISEVPCGKGQWHDQHNAWLSYGAVTARALNAQFYLSSVSGIGLMHSCCGMDILMPRVFDKISMREDTIHWDFNRYQPDLVTICLGQNDGVQDTAVFVGKYIDFIVQLRGVYPQASFVCLTSPMADPALSTFMKTTLKEVVKQVNKSGDNKVYLFFFSKQYNKGCDGHPDLSEHELIAGELLPFLKQTMNW